MKITLICNRSIVCRSSPAAGGLWMISDSVYPPELSERRRGFFFAFIFAFFNRISLDKIKREKNFLICNFTLRSESCQHSTIFSCSLTCTTDPILLLAWSWMLDQRPHPHTCWGLGQQNMEWWSSSAWLVSITERKIQVKLARSNVFFSSTWCLN